MTRSAIAMFLLFNVCACTPGTSSLERSSVPLDAGSDSGSDISMADMKTRDMGPMLADTSTMEEEMTMPDLSTSMADMLAPDMADAVDMWTCPETTRYDAITQLNATVGEASEATGTWNVFKNGEIGITHRFSGEGRLTVKAFSSDTLGWAMMRVSVGKMVLGVAHVTSKELREYSFALPQGLRGEQEIKVSYINNMVNSSGDRDLHVGEVMLDCEEVRALGNLPSGAATSLCECAGESPKVADFQQCATMRADGVGALYQPGPYELPPEAAADDTIPKGQVTSGRLGDSTIFPGTSHDYWVYTPAQYDGSEPAALMVLFDGRWYMDPNGAFRGTQVLDALIARGEMPVTVVVFVDPGKRANGDSNRYIEYNTPNDDNVRFLLEELLPATTGKLNISKDPAHRALGGASSGGSAALIAAWERPESFGLVNTTLGSFVRLRANEKGEYADVLITRIKQEAPKPLRITVQSGEMDLDNQYGNWRETHMQITAALDCAGYAYRSSYGNGRHGTNSHPRTVFPDDLRWLFERVPR